MKKTLKGGQVPLLGTIMENEKVEFKREKIGCSEHFIKEALSYLKIDTVQNERDFLYNTMTARLTAYIYTNVVDERDLTYYCERPTFLDWLLRKKKQVIFKFKAKDLLLNPPKTNVPTIRMYEIGKGY